LKIAQALADALEREVAVAAKLRVQIAMMDNDSRNNRTLRFEVERQAAEIAELKKQATAD
jgi:hypothetical protein